MSTSTLTIDEAIKNRRSLHKLSDDIDVPASRIEEIVRHAILYTPSAFNCQASRAIVLIGADHKRVWDFAHEIVKAKIDTPVFEKVFEPRVKMFRAAYGTILFYESGEALKVIGEKMPIAKDKAPQWSEQSNGMLQYAIWTMLTAEGLGVNLQHFNPFIDSTVAKEWNIPDDWSLKAQMVFGKPAGPPMNEKTFQSVEERMRFVGD